MKSVDGGIAAPRGYRASGVAAGIKSADSDKKDCALILSNRPAAVAGVFTKNVMKSPPVYWNVEVCKAGRALGVFINSGNANAATGERGHQDVRATAEVVGVALQTDPETICICSTGVIGVPLPMERVKTGVRACAENLSEDGGLDAATAIMTTDTVAKEGAVELELSVGRVRIGSIAKGSGMICPDMATMICILTTDAAIEAAALDALLREAVDVSFNQIAIDNDMSTSDTVLIFANGASSSETLHPGTQDYALFGEGLREQCQAMAKALVRDGEGATKFVEVEVSGAETKDDARSIARAIGLSQLCKTAFFGQDPNWGRIACAAGYGGVDFDPSDLAIWLDDVQIAVGGLASNYTEEEAAAVMKKDAFRVKVSVGSGSGTAKFWTSDLSHGYVTINADYRT